MSNATIPPDIDGKNDDRAQWADEALRRFMAVTGTDREDALSDFLCDALHWCDREGFDFKNELRRARGHYDAETGAAPY